MPFPITSLFYSSIYNIQPRESFEQYFSIIHGPVTPEKTKLFDRISLLNILCTPGLARGSQHVLRPVGRPFVFSGILRKNIICLECVILCNEAFTIVWYVLVGGGGG